MANQITLGSFSTNSTTGRTSGAGLVSGLDSTTLINGILQSQTDAVTAIQDQITTNSNKSAAFSQLSTLLSSFQSTANLLRGQTGFDKATSDVFQGTTTSISSSTTTAASSYISVTSLSGATENSYSITDVVTANAQAIRKDGFTSKTDSVVGDGLAFSAGTFTLRGTSITIADGDTLKSINNKINAVSKTSGVVSNIVQVSDSSYSLVLKSTTTGTANDITEFTDSGLGNSSGSIIIGGSAITFSEQQNANDSSFKLDGLAITRSTNTVSDAVSGVTFTLLSDTPTDVPPTLTATVSPDTSSITSVVGSFLAAYNNILYFNAQQTQRDSSGNYVSTAVLGDDETLSAIVNRVKSEINGIVSGLSSGAIHSLADIGVSAVTDPGNGSTQPLTSGILTLDSSVFSAALSADFQAFRSVFASTFTSSSPDVSLYQSSRQTTLTSYKLDIDTTRAVGNQVRVLDSSGSFLFNADYSNGLITGQTGTALAGEKILYTGASAQIVSITSTSGIADRSYNDVTSYLTPTTGLLDLSIQEIIDQDKQLQKNIDTDNANIAAQRAILVAKFTQLEQIISQANNTLSFLDAQTAANNAA